MSIRPFLMPPGEIVLHTGRKKKDKSRRQRQWSREKPGLTMYSPALSAEHGSNVCVVTGCTYTPGELDCSGLFSFSFFSCSYHFQRTVWMIVLYLFDLRSASFDVYVVPETMHTQVIHGSPLPRHSKQPERIPHERLPIQDGFSECPSSSSSLKERPYTWTPWDGRTFLKHLRRVCHCNAPGLEQGPKQSCNRTIEHGDQYRSPLV